MRLLCLHADTIKALASLHAPFDDLTPDGLWGTDYHLVGLTLEQRDVLRGFGIDLEDVTPARLDLGSGSARPASSMNREPVRNPGRIPEPRMEPGEGRETAPVSDRGPQSSGGVATRAPMKLRTRLKGKAVEASVQDGKIMMNGSTFDSPMHASKSLAPDKKDWELWEYYDDEAGKWYMLDKEWETA